jgi:zinc D-Ala-D-Ala dipeptidase
MKKLLVLSAILLCFNFSFAQNNSSLTKEQYANHLKVTGLVDIQEIEPQIDVYLVYSTPHNFMAYTLYKNLDRAFLRPEAAQKLKLAQKYLHEKRKDLHLVVYDAARPISIQKEMWKEVEGTNMEDYVANPNKNGGGGHNFGIAVDVTLVDCTGHPLPMGSEYDYFGDRARVDKEAELFRKGEINRRELENRELLREIMTKAGFLIEPSEWWHFNSIAVPEARNHYKVIE